MFCMYDIKWVWQFIWTSISPVYRKVNGGYYLKSVSSCELCIHSDDEGYYRIEQSKLSCLFAQSKSRVSRSMDSCIEQAPDRMLGKCILSLFLCKQNSTLEHSFCNIKILNQGIILSATVTESILQVPLPTGLDCHLICQAGVVFSLSCCFLSWEGSRFVESIEVYKQT